MKRSLPLVFIGLVLPILFSCEKERIEPTTVTESSQSADTNRAPVSKTYAYTTKSGEVQHFGTAWGELIYVGFQQNLSMEARKKLLSLFPQVDRVEGEVGMDSGMITQVRLKKGTSSREAECLRALLEKLPVVLFTAPAFDLTLAQDDIYDWIGLSNEMLVSIEGSGTMAQLEKLMKKTGTRIVVSYTDEIHVLSLNKNSKGDVLDICTYLNKSPYITEAVPNFIYQLLPMEQGELNTAPVAQTSASRRSAQLKR